MGIFTEPGPVPRVWGALTRCSCCLGPHLSALLWSSVELSERIWHGSPLDFRRMSSEQLSLDARPSLRSFFQFCWMVDIDFRICVVSHIRNENNLEYCFRRVF